MTFGLVHGPWHGTWCRARLIPGSAAPLHSVIEEG
jgi:hypothetical protein